MFATIWAIDVDIILGAGAVCAVAAGLSATLTVINRIGVNVVFWALARCVTALPPFVHSIEAWAVVRAAVFAAFLL